MSSTFQYDSPLPYDSTQRYDAYSPLPTPVTSTILPHLDARLRLQQDGSFGFLQQDTLDEVSQSVEVICDTTIGSRTVVPTFGLPILTFSNPDPGTVVNAVAQWDPRALLDVTVVPADNGEFTISVGVALDQGIS